MFSDNEIMMVAKYLNIDFSKFPFDDFKRGINIELEHGSINNLTNVTDNDLLKTAKIALAHLNEFPNYYNKDYGLLVYEEFLKNKGVNVTIRKEFGTEGSRKRQVYDIDTDLIGIEAQLSQYYQNKLNLSAEEVANLKLQREQLKAQKKELSSFSGVMSGIAEDGLGGGLLGALGLDEAGIEAFNVAVNAVMDGALDPFINGYLTCLATGNWVTK